MGLLSFLSPDKLTAQPLEVQVGDATYKMDRVRLVDLGALQERIRDRRLTALIRHGAAIQPRTVYSDALARLAALDPSEDDVFAAAATVPGQVFLLWRAINRHHPTVTEAAIVEGWEQTFRPLADALMAESGLAHVEEEAGENAGENPTTEAQSTGQTLRECFGCGTESPTEKSGA